MSNGLGRLDVPGWTGRIGGPLGRHARVSGGLWFDPVPWTIVAAMFTWLGLMVRQVPCFQTVVGQVPNSFARLCYSDIPVLYQNRLAIWSGGPLFTAVEDQTPLEYPSLTGGFIWVARWLSGVFGAVVSPAATSDQILAAANIFWAVNAVMLAACFGVLVWAHLQMGRNSGSPYTQGVRVRAWDALFIAGAPAVMMAGLINWDLFAVALTSLGLLAWSRKRPFAAGLLIGLAVAVKFYPLALLPVLLVLCTRAGRLKPFGKFTGGMVLAWVAANLPVLVTPSMLINGNWSGFWGSVATNFSGWSYFWVYNAGRGPDFGSLWSLVVHIGIPILNVSVAEVVCLSLVGLFVVGLTFTAPRRPRLAQVAVLVLIAFLVFNKVYSPQYVLWLLPLLVLARPVLLDMSVFAASEGLYFLAIWGHLADKLSFNGHELLYWLAILLRIGVQIWLATRVVNDIQHPWIDPVREPFVDDPIGGVLDHQPDVVWLRFGQSKANE